MSSAVVAASAIDVWDDDPDVLAVGFRCESVGPSCFIGLERAYRPSAGDSRYFPGEVSLELDLRPLANLGCTPGAVLAVRVSPERVVLELRGGLDPELGDLRVIEIRYTVDERLGERLRTVLGLMFEGTSTALDAQDAEPAAPADGEGM